MLIYRFGNWKPSKTAIDEIFKTSLIVLEIGIMEPRAQVLGGVGIFDLEAIVSALKCLLIIKITFNDFFS
jgi:hypothetical protein